MRLAKYLAHAGVASRRAAEQLVFAGRVTVGGEVVRDPARDVGEGDAIAVDGRRGGARAPARRLRAPQAARLRQHGEGPAGPPDGRLAGPEPRAAVPVGRLDAETTGLILLTNDGELAHRLTHPSFEVPRVYRAQVRSPPVREPALRSCARACCSTTARRRRRACGG